MTERHKSPSVAFAMTGDVRVNSRAIRQIRALASMNLDVRVFAWGPPGFPDPLEASAEIHFVEQPSGRGPSFFYRNDRRFRHALSATEADVYHASDLYTLPACVNRARQTGARVVFDSRELYPYVGHTSRKPWASLFWHFLESHYISKADVVFTVNDSIADRLKHTYGISRPAVVHNVPSGKDSRPGDPVRSQAAIDDDRPVILYQGHLKKGRGCYILMDAMRDVDRAWLVFMGDGPIRAELKRMASEPGLQDRVRFIDPVPPDQILSVTSTADIGACLIEDLSLSLRFALPNKLFEYLMSKLPVVVSNLPEMAKIVHEYEVGKIVDIGNREEVVDAFQTLADSDHLRHTMAENAETVIETYNWDNASKVFMSEYTRILPT